MESQEQQRLHAQAEETRGKLQALNGDLRAVDGEVDSLAPQREHYELLDQACGSLEKLSELGAASLFWGECSSRDRVAEQLREVRSRAGEFQQQIGELEQRRQAILEEMGREEEVLEILGEDIYDIQTAEEARKNEWIVEREISELSPRMQFLAWARGGKDDKRFYKSLGASLAVGLLLGALLPLIDLPLPKRFVPEEMPKRLAQLVREEQAKLIPPPPIVAESQEQKEPDPVDDPKPPEQPEEIPPESPMIAEATPTTPERPGEPAPEIPGAAVAEAPRQRVQKAGILAFRDKFASLAKDDVAPKLGVNARLSDADDSSRASTRSMLTTNAPGSSGGINLASLSRNTGGGGYGDGGDGDGVGGSGGIHGVQVGRATSSIASIGGGARPLASGGPGATRTDEEIQIVFDRYKASFYRLYNRELRNDPTLRGQIVLRLTIEPDGSVSMCALQSSDMDAPDLAAQVVSRVRMLNFGAKDVEAMTIVYPIDFLPAS